MQDEHWEKDKVNIKASELEFGPKIAEGKYGTVYKGKCRGQTVAIKLLHNQHLSGEKLEELRTEVEIMSRLRHPCILLFMGVCTETNNVALVMEYVEGKSLDRILHDPKIPLSFQQQMHLAKDIAKGMNWLHCLDPPIIHRDIKPPNILVNANFDVKVCDFGLSCVKEIPKPDEELRDTAVGSPIWMAPEVLSGHLASEKSDVYAYAIVLWEIMTRKAPFSNVRSFEQFLDDVIDNHIRPPIPENLLPSLKNLIECCWNGNPKKRPSFAEILDILDDVVIELLIKDEDGRELWKKMKSQETMGEHFPFFVAWDGFVEALCSLLNAPEHSSSADIGYLCMRTMLAEEHKDYTRDKKFMKVTVEAFGRFLNCFGPLKDTSSSGDNIITRFVRTCEQEWFHGAITKEQAEVLLTKGIKEQKKGYFLVRLSSNLESCFTISRLNSSNKVVHQRIVRNRAGQYVIAVGETVKKFDTLIECITGLEDVLNLKTPCAESRVFSILFLGVEVSGNYVFNSRSFESMDNLRDLANGADDKKEKKKKKKKENGKEKGTKKKSTTSRKKKKDKGSKNT
ncbi:Dual specificity protein kinase [Balamuthia mandrillaris]